MKQFILLLATLLTFGWATAQQYGYKYLGDYTSDGTPLYFDGKDNVSQETLDMISNALPEGFPVPNYNPQYITSGYDTDIILDKDADVWVTFVGEGAGYKNVLGFYTYDVDQPQLTAPKEEDITIIFPNVSAKYSGGSLETGHKVKIGRFSAGTGIGWVLLANGWKGQVTPGLWQLFSNPDYNPEALEFLRHHNVLLNDPDNERIILGFEDIRRDYASCDNDFNDALFYITANPYEAIKTTNYNKITDHAPVTSGNDGGLESNGDLASLIAKRNFDRNKANTFKNKRALQNKYDKKTYKSLMAKSGNLDGYFPSTGMFGTETSYVSSPEDLLAITNADEVFGIDYYQGTDRVSAALALNTKGEVYNHTKTICDRLNNSKLKDLRTIELQGHKLIYSELERANGNVEYAVVFSVKEDGADRTVYSRWNLAEYPAGDYMNFQVWGNSMGQVSTVVNEILANLGQESTLKSNDGENVLPTVFIQNGYYKNGKLHLNIINKSKATWLLLDGNYKTTEQENLQNLNTIIDLNGEWEQEITVESGHLFDMGLSIIAENSYQHDAIYLADGPWGVDYNTQSDSVEVFEVVEHQEWDLDGHIVERGVVAKGEVKETINVFRNILAGDLQLPIDDYQYLHFNIKNQTPVEISLVTDATSEWSERLRYSLDANAEKTQYSLSFSDFVNHEGKNMDFGQLRTIVISVQGDYQNYTSFELEVDQMALTVDGEIQQEPENEQEDPTTDETNSLDLGDDLISILDPNTELELKNYPNPFVEYTDISLPEKTSKVYVHVVNLSGQVLYADTHAPTGNENTIRLELGHLPKGIYLYQVGDVTNSKRYSGKIIRQ
ncbi:DUF4114 domain-containing protein [Allomuricauda sp. XS_ASV26]|uniref:DUF4114 domain-containing protein n=1 Tax=Flagellimonas marinaquae TaxID=254955 RepID=A0AA48HWG2_9FLAO|nr:hypothetical protein MACH07_01530 [Allomuricauda aquimarina]